MTDIQNDIFLFPRNYPYTQFDSESKVYDPSSRIISSYPSIPQPSDYENAFVVDWQMTENN